LFLFLFFFFSSRSSGPAVRHVHSRRSRHRRANPALTSSWEEVFSHPFPALRGLERPFVLPLGRISGVNLSIEPPGIRNRPGLPVRLRAHLPARWNRTVTFHALPRKTLSSAFIFQRSPLRRSRIVESTPKPDCSGSSSVGRYASRPFRPCGFTPLRRFTPRRSCPHCCSGSRPWGSSSFHLQPKLRDSRDACSALRSFPSADSCRRRTLRRHLAMRAVHAGRLSPPARSSPCSAARLAPSLEAC